MREIHHTDLCAIALLSGLTELPDPSAWLEERGVCSDCAAQYAERVREVAVADEETELDVAIEGIFHTGLSLGLAIGEARERERRAAS